MSGRLKASLCLPHGSLKSTKGVCFVVFLPSIHTSDQGTELTVMEQSPPSATLAEESSAPAPSSLSRCRRRRSRPELPELAEALPLVVATVVPLDAEPPDGDSPPAAFAAWRLASDGDGLAPAPEG